MYIIINNHKLIFATLHFVIFFLNFYLIRLLTEGAAFSQTSLTTCGLAQNSGAASAEDNSGSMAKHGGAKKKMDKYYLLV